LPGWRKPTSGITRLEKLPPQARAYLGFVEKETGARIGMVSTGPDREQSLFLEEFTDQLRLESISGRVKARA
jgi:adenylosuccinate synthase